MKLYRTRTQAEYDWLARELSKKGMVSYIPRHEQGGDIVVYADEKEDYLSYSDLDYAEKECPNEPIIEVSDLMNNKFNVGDEVRIIKNAGGTITDRRGEVHTVVRVNPKGLYPYELSNTLLYPEDCLEPITDHDYLMDKILERNNKPEAYTPPNTGDPWIDNLPESYFEMYEEESKTDKYARHKEITDDKVNSPSHYTRGDIEVIDIIKQLTQGYEPFEAYLVGNTIKYLARANFKENKQQDLEKAEWHINKLLEEEE